MEISILQYLGTINNGVLVLLSIMFNNKYYEATFFYNAEDIVFTPSDELEEDIGVPLKEYDGYVAMLKSILKQIAPFKEIKSQLKPFNP